MTVDLRGAELHSADPRYHRQIEAGRLALKLNYTAVVSRCQFLGWSFSLVSPDGTDLDSIGVGDPDTSDRFVLFLVSERPAGAYTLKLEGEAKGSTGPRCPPTITAQTTFQLA